MKGTDKDLNQDKILTNAAQISKVKSLRAKIERVLSPVRENSNWGIDKSTNWEAFIRTVSLLPPQSYGPRIEAKIISESGFNSVSKSNQRGDFVTQNGINYECKATVLTHNTSQMNFVQIRPNHETNYYLVAFDIRRSFEVYPFELSAEQMFKEVELSGNVAHGNQINELTEYRISIPISNNNNVFNRWMNDYFVDEHPLFKKYKKDVIATEDILYQKISLTPKTKVKLKM